MSSRGGQHSQRSRRHRPDRKITFVCTDRGRHAPITVGYATWYTRKLGLPGRVQFHNVGGSTDSPAAPRPSTGGAHRRRRTQTFVCGACGRSVPMSREKWQPFVLRLGDARCDPIRHIERIASHVVGFVSRWLQGTLTAQAHRYGAGDGRGPGLERLTSPPFTGEPIKGSRGRTE